MYKGVSVKFFVSTKICLDRVLVTLVPLIPPGRGIVVKFDVPRLSDLFLFFRNETLSFTWFDYCFELRARAKEDGVNRHTTRKSGRGIE